MRVLLIEDNPGDARLVQELLKEAQGNFTFSVAEKLGSGMKLLLSQDTDVVLLDLNLPDSHGLVTLTELQTRFSRIPIVIMTSQDDEELAQKAVHLGAQDYLAKGDISGELLRRTLGYAIERKKSEVALRTAHDELELRVEERTQELKKAERGLKELNETLEERVAERTAELQGVNIFLRNSRRATLNIMEDALAARKSAEEANVELWKEVAERKRGEEALFRLNKAMKALSDSSQAVIRAKDEPEYLNDVCRLIVEDCGYSMTWIGFAENDEAKSVRPKAHAGFEEGYLETLKLTWADTERGRGPTGTAIRTGKVAVCRNMLIDPAFAPWREEAIKRGYASSIVFPLRADGRVFGALTLYSKEPDPFTGDEVGLLTELADNVAHGIEVLRIRAAQAQAEEALRLSEEKFSLAFANNPAAIAMTRLEDGLFLEVNDTWLAVNGYGRNEVIGRSARKLPIWPSVEASARFVRELREKGIVRGWEQEFLKKSGEVFIAQLSAQILTVRGEQVILSTLVDITERKRSEDETEATVEFLRIVNASHNAEELIHAATDFFQERSGCEAVGIRLHEEHDYPYFETRGFSKEFVQLESRLCSCDKEGNPLLDSVGNPVLACMCGNVICGRFDPSKPFFSKRGSFWSNGTTELLATTTDADRQARTRNQCNGEGYESVALIGLTLGEERLGLLQLNDRRKNRFASESITLWERLADYLAVALAKFRADEALRESEERYRSLFENMLHGFAHCKMLYDEAGRPLDFIYLDVNSAFEKLTGLKNVVGKRVTAVIPGIREAHPELFAIYGRVASTGRPENVEIEFKPLGLWLSISVYSILREHFVAIFDDITERKKAETDIMKLSEDLAIRNMSLESVNKELESFIYSVSHDLRAPIRTMSGFAKILNEDYTGKLDAKGQDYLNRILNGSDKATQLINDLLHLSKISRQEPDRIEVNLSKKVSKVVEQLREMDGGRNVEIVVQEGLTASVDPRLIEIALSNLLGNAWKFTSKTEHARIEFGACSLRNADCGMRNETMMDQVKRGKTVYFIRDNGAGFDMTYADKMFWPFHRLHGEKEFEGTGIGLTIVERIIRRHGGKVWAEGEVGKGATVFFTL